MAGGCGCLILAAAIFGAIIYLGVKAGTAGAEEAVKGFLKAAGAEDYKAAYDYFSVPLKESQSFREFRSGATANPHLFKVKDTTFNQRSVDTSSAKLSGTLTLESGTEVPAKFELVKENDKWRLISYNIGSGG